MQGSELRAIRGRLGLSQSDFGAALGMTYKFIGMMERGEASIERRTELAALYLDEHPEAASAIEKADR